MHRAAVLGSILEAIGDTPLVALDRLRPPRGGRILAKIEALNPSGSVKARPAYAMVKAAEQQGLLRPGSTIVEASSGNQGIALAMVGAVLGYKVRIFMPEGMSSERTTIMRALGADVEETPARHDIGESVQLAIACATEYADRDPDACLAAQFANPANPDAHARSTAQEVLAALGPSGHLNAFVAGIGTGGTLTGTGRVLRERFPRMLVVAVEPTAAPVLRGGVITNHAQQGIGDGLVPEILDRSLIDEVIAVADADAKATAQQLAKCEGLLCGMSSGSNIWAAQQLAARLGVQATVLTVCPDSGERYLSTGMWDGSGEPGSR